MSSILEALKKLEDEKTARRGGAALLTGKVTSTGRRVAYKRPWLIAAAMMAVAVAAVVGTYAAMKWLPTKQAQPAAVSGAAISPPPAQHVVEQESSHIAVTATGPAGAVPPLEQASPAAPVHAPAPQPTMKTQRRGASSPPATAAAGKAPPLRPLAEPRRSTFNVTGIAWQQQNASRLAVVNDIPVTEGSVIEGARVKEIHPDHLRFAIDGKEFDVYLEKEPS